MPAYNSERVIGESIRSVLDQTFADFELLICDDCSTDSTVDVIRSFGDPRIRLLHNEKNLGISENRNRLIREARGEFCAILDNDDLALPSRLQIQVEFLDANPHIDVCSGLVELLDERPEPTQQGDVWYQNVADHESIKTHTLFGCAVAQTTIMFRRERFLEEGIRYIPEAGFADDMGMYREAVHRLRFENLHVVLGKYRFGAGQENPEKQRLQNRQALDSKIYQYDKLGVELTPRQEDMFLIRPDEKLRAKYFKDFRDFSYRLLEANKRQKIFDNVRIAGTLLWIYRRAVYGLPFPVIIFYLREYKKFKKNISKYKKGSD